MWLFLTIVPGWATEIGRSVNADNWRAKKSIKATGKCWTIKTGQSRPASSDSISFWMIGIPPVDAPIARHSGLAISGRARTGNCSTAHCRPLRPSRRTFSTSLSEKPAPNPVRPGFAKVSQAPNDSASSAAGPFSSTKEDTTMMLAPLEAVNISGSASKPLRCGISMSSKMTSTGLLACRWDSAASLSAASATINISSRPDSSRAKIDRAT